MITDFEVIKPPVCKLMLSWLLLAEVPVRRCAVYLGVVCYTTSCSLLPLPQMSIVNNREGAHFSISQPLTKPIILFHVKMTENCDCFLSESSQCLFECYHWGMLQSEGFKYWHIQQYTRQDMSQSLRDWSTLGGLLLPGCLELKLLPFLFHLFLRFNLFKEDLLSL